MREQIAQLKEEIGGLAAQEQAKEKEIELIEKELIGVRELFAKNLVQISRLTVLERDPARLDGERAQFIAPKAQAKGKITETELQIIQIDKDWSAKSPRKCARSTTRSASSSSARSRRRIIAPHRHPRAAGRHRVAVDGSYRRRRDHRRRRHHADRAEADNLSVEAKVNPQDIDKLQIGQKTLLRLSAFNQRTTPELNGVVTRVSPTSPPTSAPARATTPSASRCRRKRSRGSAT